VRNRKEKNNNYHYIYPYRLHYNEKENYFQQHSVGEQLDECVIRDNDKSF
jgi:hypothetical protein